MRRPILAANWKMHKTPAQAEAFAEAFLPLVKGTNRVDIVLAPAAPALERLGRALGGSAVALASQNVHPEPKGAFTGEMSVEMIGAVGCRYAIVGHSERRALFAETSLFVAEKAQALLAGGIRPIVCVGETLDERESDRAFEIIGKQLDESLSRVSNEQAEQVVVAYEPVWAIGTGKTATPEVAQEVHAFIREQLGKRFGESAERMRIQYGGSVKPDNIAELMAKPDIDGALVGGAGLEPEGFAKIACFDRETR